MQKTSNGSTRVTGTRACSSPCIEPGCGQTATMSSPARKGACGERSAEVMAAKRGLEAQQEQEKNALSAGKIAFVDELWFNFRALQIFDLLSLYFCCDGYADDEQFKEDLIAPVSRVL